MYISSVELDINEWFDSVW